MELLLKAHFCPKVPSGQPYIYMTTNDDPVVSAIQLPRDQYGHEGAPTEWWWHVGTLKTADGRAFGFEINACGVLAGLAFTEIAITDLQNQVHYQIVNDMSPVPANWAEYDPTQPWFVSLPGTAGSANGAVSMTAIDGNPMNMAIEAAFTDSATNAECAISLTLYDQGPPLLVWGTGVHIVDPAAPTPITQNNYYYSLTNLQASGTITINGEVCQVTGLTWMDHEYGAFPNPPGGKNVWTLQDMQLGNGLHLSNYTQFQVKPQNNVPMPSNATLLLPGGESLCRNSDDPVGPANDQRR